ncbi:MAG: hypothetical protein HYY09_05410 [Firmicutes bacterium]|nr:hypothetical protein [Bacillota bacterium]
MSGYRFRLAQVLRVKELLEKMARLDLESSVRRSREAAADVEGRELELESWRGCMPGGIGRPAGMGGPTVINGAGTVGTGINAATGTDSPAVPGPARWATGDELESWSRWCLALERRVAESRGHLSRVREEERRLAGAAEAARRGIRGLRRLDERRRAIFQAAEGRRLQKELDAAFLSRQDSNNLNHD